ncbi:acyltransferase [Chromobacterium haemolyticum]|nr:acyltransferase [Chromobacterium haemolyticum]
MRALAVLSVVAFHIGLPGFGGGFVGVDIFFVISGFLISGLLRQELLAQGRIDFKAFYARRIRRLAPALALVLAASLVLAYFVMLPDDQIKLGREVRAVATLSANHHFLKHAFDYFDSDADLKVFLHTWSLAVEEEQYYLSGPCCYGPFSV